MINFAIFQNKSLSEVFGRIKLQKKELEIYRVVQKKVYESI